MPKSQRDPAREQFWRQALADWRASGRTIREFCHDRQLPRSAFDHWQRELKRRDRSPAPTIQPPTFVPVTVVASPRLPPPPGVAVEVRCPSGHVVTLTGEDFALRDLFAALATATEDTPC